jgi:hypothetical protein
VVARGGMATGDRGVARRAKTGLPRHSVVTAGGSGGVPLGFATDAPRGSAGSFTFVALANLSMGKTLNSASPRSLCPCSELLKIATRCAYSPR